MRVLRGNSRETTGASWVLAEKGGFLPFKTSDCANRMGAHIFPTVAGWGISNRVSALDGADAIQTFRRGPEESARWPCDVLAAPWPLPRSAQGSLRRVRIRAHQFLVARAACDTRKGGLLHFSRDHAPHHYLGARGAALDDRQRMH